MRQGRARCTGDIPMPQLVGRHTLEKRKQAFEHVGLRDGVRIKNPDPVEAVLQGKGKIDSNRAARA
jgi:hypothetical protein